MHVRLKILETRRFLQHREVVRRDDRVRRDINVAARAGGFGRLESAQGLEARQVCAMLRLLSFRIEPQRDLDVIANLFAGGVEMNVPRYLRAGQNQLAGIGSVQIVALADSPFHQVRACI